MAAQLPSSDGRRHAGWAALVRFMTRPALSRGSRRAMVALWLVGAAIAGGVAPVAAVRQSAASGLLFALVAAALVVLAIWTGRAARWAEVVSVALLALQVVGTVGSAVELVRGVGGDKAAQLRRLGVDPTVGVALNLAYSAIAVVVLVHAWRGVTREAS